MQMLRGFTTRRWLQHGPRGRWVYSYNLEDGPKTGAYVTERDAVQALCLLVKTLDLSALWAKGY